MSKEINVKITNGEIIIQGEDSLVNAAQKIVDALDAAGIVCSWIRVEDIESKAVVEV